MSVEIVAVDGTVHLFPTNQQIQSVRFMLGSTMIELNANVSKDNQKQESQHDQQPPPEITKKEENKKRKKEVRSWLMVLASLLASMAFQAGLNPPGGLWQDDLPKSSQLAHNNNNNNNNTTTTTTSTTAFSVSPSSSPSSVSDNNSEHTTGYSILEDKEPVRYHIFYFLNTPALVYSMGTVMLLLSDRFYAQENPERNLKFVLLFDMIIFYVAYAVGSFRDQSHNWYAIFSFFFSILYWFSPFLVTRIKGLLSNIIKIIWYKYEGHW